MHQYPGHYRASFFGRKSFASRSFRAPTVVAVTEAELVVDVRGLTKWFGETTALEQVDFSVSPGALHGLLGPNGAGKTTLLSVLFGLVLPDEGTVRLFGRTRQEADRNWLDGVGGFVETPRFYPYLSAKQNLSVLAGLDGGDAADLIDMAIERVGLASAGRKKVRGYSLGMRQRLGLAAAMLRRPRLLILDEPTNGMDPAGIRDLRAALRRLANDGVTVVLSSHDMAQVEEICDSVTVLNHGEVAFAGRLDKMRADAPDPVWRLRTSDDGAAVEAVAVVDPEDDPNAASDLATYRSTYGLGPCTTKNGCFKKVNQEGVQGDYPSPNAGFAQEISLDLDMVSAICPHCHILLVEANSNGFSDLGAAIDEAIALGAKVVSDSWGTSEFDGETGWDGYVDQPGVAITFSSGDGAYQGGVQYPSASPYVTSVGGTELTPASSSRG
jgi:ABC-2 type transport system ATP-binding protein